MHQNDERPADGEKRGIYVVFFYGAVIIDLALSTFRGEPYRSTLFDLAIKITSAFFYLFVASVTLLRIVEGKDLSLKSQVCLGCKPAVGI
ncbi:MAG: hypothetical protein VX941_05420 [Pseudomonadota bacterium]|nr:hypothetical protein [Pseudomonadota bacterium]